MIYLKSYCYSKHELPFIKAQLDESKGYVDKFILYEYDMSHCGTEKPYELDGMLPDDDRLVYKKVSLKGMCECDDTKTHTVNERIQRCYFFNDPDIKLDDDDIIFDVDVDEIVYSNCYPQLINNYTNPVSIRLNQFFFKNTYLWTDCNFAAPCLYKYKHLKNTFFTLKGINVTDKTRYYQNKTPGVCGCHLSWIMPVSYMVKKLYMYSHPEYRKFADVDVLKKAIDDKKYIFDPKVSFNIDELELTDYRIPTSLRSDNLFEYLTINSS